MASNVILSEKRRMALFKQKVAALFKEARKISTSCDAKVGILIAKPGGSEIIGWPSPEVAKRRLVRYLKSPEAKRKRQIVIRKKFLLNKLISLKASLAQIKKENAKMYAEFLLFQALSDRTILKELGEEELDILLSITGEDIKMHGAEIQRRKKNAQPQSTDADVSSLEPVSSVVAGVPVVSSSMANDQGTGASGSSLAKTNQETTAETGTQCP
ncbi:hypothetical protein Leryth_021323 [Lithospermum erythrorhizon]|nr:hypothetical protein Leryth_021323 [Lithospermum erythrorhizon]